MLLKVGLLLDSRFVPAWQKSIIEYINHHPHLRLELVVLNGYNQHPGNPGRLIYRMLRKLDRQLFKVKHNQFEIFDISNVVNALEGRIVTVKRSRHKDEFLPEDIDWIRQQQPDILIRFGFRILTGDILKVARYGLWSLHHGDSAVNRGGPPAFWEVVNGEPITAVTLQVLSEKLDSGQVLGKAYCKTDFTSFNRNQQSVYAAGVELFCSKLHQISVKGPETFFNESSKSDQKQFAKTLYRDPDNLKALLIAFTFFWGRLVEFLGRMFYRDQWVIFFHQKQDSPFSFVEANLLLSPRKEDWADPFLFRYQHQDYVFFESLDKRVGKGKIKCVRMDKIRMDPFPVLEENYHLSYPTITEHDGKLYLLAESASAKDVGLYECIEFPQQWRKLRPLLNDVELYDPTLHFQDGMWYLFGTQRPVPGASADMYLHIYFSTDLLEGHWQPHALNPLTRDVRGARPAGRIFKFNGKLFRPAQIGTPKYGYGVRFQEIVKLSPTEFEEAPVDDILPWMPGMLATHTYSSSNGFFVTDGQLKRFHFF